MKVKGALGCKATHIPADLRWHLRNMFCRQICDGPSHLQNFSPADLTWHLLACNMFYRRFAMAPSHLQHVLPPDLRWRLLTCKIFHLQICDVVFSPIFGTGRGIFSPVMCFTASAFSLQYFVPVNLRWLTYMFHRQICDGAFSRAIFCTCRFEKTPSRGQCVLPPDLMTPSHLQKGKFAMAPSCLESETMANAVEASASTARPRKLKY